MDTGVQLERRLAGLRPLPCGEEICYVPFQLNFLPSFSKVMQTYFTQNDQNHSDGAFIPPSYHCPSKGQIKRPIKEKLCGSGYLLKK